MGRVPPRATVLGIGNADRGDDAAGREVARLLRHGLPAAVRVLERNGEATGLLDHLDGADAAFLVDACAPSGLPGRVHRFDLATSPVPVRGLAGSTHGLGLTEAVELARALGRLPPLCILYAIEGKCFDEGAPLSPELGTSIHDVAGRIRAEISRLIPAADIDLQGNPKSPR